MENNLGNKKIMAANIKYQMDLHGKTRNDVCNVLNVPYTTFRDWICAKTYPRIDKIELMANYFGVNKSDLVEDREGLSRPHLKGLEVVPLPSKKRIPILGKIAAGKPIVADEYIEEYVYVDDDRIDYGLRVQGDSMIGARICDGDTVYIAPREKIDIANGDIVVAIVNDDEATLKRFYHYGDEVILRSENPTIAEMHFPIEDVRIIGKAMEFRGKIR
ncbi:MAG: transcriptional regulator [Spirochaetia bacterium]|jgi:repressor LexA|nr:transcriptional regulator [Spirochaetia bacterium]